jgi:hypothetical protein
VRLPTIGRHAERSRKIRPKIETQGAPNAPPLHERLTRIHRGRRILSCVVVAPSLFFPPLVVDAVDQPFGYSPPRRLKWYCRLPLVVGGSILLGLLATAACLEPAKEGYGTHRKLGLAECGFLTLTKDLRPGGFRCPACGMTTSWAHLVRGQVFGAVKCNVGGTLLALLSMAAAPWLLVSGLRGRWLWGWPNEVVIASLGVAVVVVTLIDWGLRNFVLG